MKKHLLCASVLLCSAASYAMANSAPDLISVYRVAVQNDPKFKQALATRQEAEQSLPLAVASLLPQINLTGTGTYDETSQNGSTRSFGVTTPINDTTKSKSLGFELQATQTIFNFTNWMQVASANNSVKAAYATYTDAVQDLLQRVSKAYFDVLDAKDSLYYTVAAKKAFYRQYMQALESYKVGVKTITDVYNAKAAYDSAVSDYVTATNELADRKEDLRAITGVYFNKIATLKRLPLIKPFPQNLNAWAGKSVKYNWGLVAAHYTVLSAKDDIKAAFGGHLPSLAFQGSFSNTYEKGINTNHKSRTKDLSGSLELTVPIFSGGQVTAQVKQSIAKYNLASSQMEQTYRDVTNQARQAYLGVVSGISKVLADEQTVVSSKSSYEGTYEGYKVGTQTMINVLTAEKDLYQQESQLATDRYAYINNVISLKRTAGTLTLADIGLINRWLHGRQNLFHSKKHRQSHLSALTRQYRRSVK
jgi:outer membrane protein